MLSVYALAGITGLIAILYGACKIMQHKKDVAEARALKAEADAEAADATVVHHEVVAQVVADMRAAAEARHRNDKREAETGKRGAFDNEW